MKDLFREPEMKKVSILSLLLARWLQGVHVLWDSWRNHLAVLVEADVSERRKGICRRRLQVQL